MADGRPNCAGTGGSFASRAEIHALSELIAATLTMAARTRSTAAAALLERALDSLNDRIRALAAQEDDCRQSGLRTS